MTERLRCSIACVIGRNTSDLEVHLDPGELPVRFELEALASSDLRPGLDPEQARNMAEFVRVLGIVTPELQPLTLERSPKGARIVRFLLENRSTEGVYVRFRVFVRDADEALEELPALELVRRINVLEAELATSRDDVAWFARGLEESTAERAAAGARFHELEAELVNARLRMGEWSAQLEADRAEREQLERKAAALESDLLVRTSDLRWFQRELEVADLRLAGATPQRVLEQGRELERLEQSNAELVAMLADARERIATLEAGEELAERDTRIGWLELDLAERRVVLAERDTRIERLEATLDAALPTREERLALSRYSLGWPTWSTVRTWLERLDNVLAKRAASVKA